MIVAMVLNSVPPDAVVQIQHLFKVVLPLILGSGLGAFLSGVLSQDSWQNSKNGRIGNASIVCIVTGIFALASAFAAGTLTGDYTNDFYIIATAFTTILSTAGFAPLRQFVRSSFFVLPDKSDPLASRSVPTVQDSELDKQTTMPSLRTQSAALKYQTYANQQTQVAPVPTQQGYDVDVPATTSDVPLRTNRVTPTSGGVASNAYVPQQQFREPRKYTDMGG